VSSELTRRLKALKKTMREVAQRSAEQAAQKALEESSAIVPVQSGRLRDSGNARLVSVTNLGAQSSVYYTAPYAPNVHENGNSTGYKWLERAVVNVDFAAILQKNWKESQ